MTRILAIETSTDIAGAALLGAGDLRAALAFRAHRDVARRLIPEIRDLMEQNGVTAGSLSAVAAGRGPGSFTGIRIGVSIAKGLSLALDIPIYGISTLAACAYPALGADGVACALIPAHGDEFYSGIFRAETLEPVAEAIVSGAALMQQLSELGQPVTFVSVDEQVRARLPLKALRVEHRFAAPALTRHLASSVGRLAQARIDAGDAGDGIGLAPVYLRPSQAETAGEQQTKDGS
jgi:tRNA threonylcarbamoyladenosine biosynthesis protein TsaB